MSTDDTKQRIMRDLYAQAIAHSADWTHSAQLEEDEYWDQPYAVVQSDNEDRHWIAPCQSYDEARRNAYYCVAGRDSAYAWWPIAILDIERERIEIVDVAVTVTTREVPT